MQIFNFFKKKIKSEFIKKFITLFTGSAIGRVFVFLSIPILTRLFNTNDFGIYALYISLIFILKIFATLRYELSILLPKRDKDAINLLAFSSLIVFIFSLFLFFMVSVFFDAIITTLKFQQNSFIVYFIPLSVFFLGNISILEHWCNRTNLFRNISLGTVSKSFTMTSTQLLTGFSTYKFIGLVPGVLLGQLVNFILILKLAFNRLKIDVKHVSTKRMLYVAHKYRDIPIFNTILTFTNTFSNELPVLLITKYYGIGSAGIYSLALKVSNTPSGIIGQSISPVFFNEASNVYNSKGNLYELVKKTYKNLFIVSLFIFVPLFISSYFLDFIFGENWNSIGKYVRILIPWLFIGSLSTPISSIVDILNKQKHILIYNLVLLNFRFFALYFGYSIWNDVYISLLLFSSVGVFFNSILFIYFLKIAKDSILNKKEIYT